MIKRQLIDEIQVLNRTVQPAFLAGFNDNDLSDYLNRLLLTRRPRLTGNAQRYDKYFVSCKAATDVGSQAKAIEVAVEPEPEAVCEEPAEAAEPVVVAQEIAAAPEPVVEQTPAQTVQTAPAKSQLFAGKYMFSTGDTGHLEQSEAQEPALADAQTSQESAQEGEDLTSSYYSYTFSPSLDDDDEDAGEEVAIDSHQAQETVSVAAADHQSSKDSSDTWLF